MKSKGAAFVALEEALQAPVDDDLSFESSSLIRELKKSVAHGDDEVTLILAKAFCDKHLKAQIPSQECVIYCRVSTEQQAIGGGLSRQLRACADYARRHDYIIAAIFSEVASGVDPLPVRATMERMATKRGCLILCEDHSRWPRKGADDLPPAFVRMTSESSMRFDKSLMEMIGKYGDGVTASA